jgi:hypothetical protein
MVRNKQIATNRKACRWAKTNRGISKVALVSTHGQRGDNNLTPKTMIYLFLKDIYHLMLGGMCIEITILTWENH